MAITKATKTGFGNDATVWEVTAVECNFVSGVITFKVSGWIDSGVKTAGSRAIVKKHFDVKVADQQSLADTLKTAAETHLSGLDTFEDPPKRELPESFSPMSK